MRSSLVLALALTACAPSSSLLLDGPLWDPDGAVAVRGGLYVPLPHRGHLAWLTPDGEADLVPLRPATVVDLAPAPDDETVVAFLHHFTCTPEGRSGPIRTPADCHPADLEIDTELAVLRDGTPEAAIPVAGQYRSLAFSEDASRAIAWIDLEQDLGAPGVIDLTSVLVLDLEGGEAAPVSVGFAAREVLFTPDATRAVVLSQSEVAVLDLTASPPTREVSFPLTLDAGQTVEPKGVGLTPDGRFALIHVEGSGDLYILDLDVRSVNLVALTGAPSAMAVSEDFDQSVFTFPNAPRIDVLDHTHFDRTSLSVPGPSTDLLDVGPYVLAWHRDGQGVFKVAQDDLRVTEYHLQNPAVGLHVAPTLDYGIALTRAEATGSANVYDRHPGMEILDLREGQRRIYPYLLEGQGLGVAWGAHEAGLDALVLQHGVDYLYALDVMTGLSRQIDLVAPPIDIGTIPDGPFYVTHDAGLGLVTFLDPDTYTPTEVEGFAALGLLDPAPVTVEDP